MKFDEVLEIIGNEPVLHSSVLVAGGVDPADLGRQLSRWVGSGKLIQLRRGLYSLSERYRKTPPHAFVVANRLRAASYVSLQSALEYHGLIPEYVPSVTSVTTGRPGTFSNPLGTFIYRHIKRGLFSHYTVVDVGNGLSAFVAEPEKAILDLLYLTPHSDDPLYIRELRLQNVEALDTVFLKRLAEESGSRKLERAVTRIRSLLVNMSGS